MVETIKKALYSGLDLSLHSVSRILLSALRRFKTLFGMEVADKPQRELVPPRSRDQNKTLFFNLDHKLVK